VKSQNRNVPACPPQDGHVYSVSITRTDALRQGQEGDVKLVELQKGYMALLAEGGLRSSQTYKHYPPALRRASRNVVRF